MCSLGELRQSWGFLEQPCELHRNSKSPSSIGPMTESIKKLFLEQLYKILPVQRGGGITISGGV